jgi:hypothetical protein
VNRRIYMGLIVYTVCRYIGKATGWKTKVSGSNFPYEREIFLVSITSIPILVPA